MHERELERAEGQKLTISLSLPFNTLIIIFCSVLETQLDEFEHLFRTYYEVEDLENPAAITEVRVNSA